MDAKPVEIDVRASNTENDVATDASDVSPAAAPQDADAEAGVVITKVDDLIIKSYPDGSTVVIRPDGLQLRQDQDNTSTVIVSSESTTSDPSPSGPKVESHAADTDSASTNPGRIQPRIVSQSLEDAEFDLKKRNRRSSIQLSLKVHGSSIDDTNIAAVQKSFEPTQGDIIDDDEEESAVDFSAVVVEDNTDMYVDIDDETLMEEDWCLTTTFSSSAPPIRGTMPPTAPSTATNGDSAMPPPGNDDVAITGNNVEAVHQTGAPSRQVRVLHSGTSPKSKAHTPHNPGSSLPFHSGYLFKEGGSIRTWKRRWFELHDSGQLLYYDKEKAIGGHFLNSVDVSQSQVAPDPHNKRPFCFVVQTMPEYTGISNKRSRYVLCASNAKDKDRWLNSLRLAAQHADCENFYATTPTTKNSPRDSTLLPSSPPSNTGGGKSSRGLGGLTKGLGRKMQKSIKHWKPSDRIRAMVSKKKFRFQEKGPSGHAYDLDLAYISEHIIAMGYPSDGAEALYRNKHEEVRRFLDDFHPHHYKVYNLCSERAYPANRFKNKVAVYPFDDHGVPPLSLIQSFCDDMEDWLGQDADNVAAVHCKAGKGRTGLMLCCYMMHSGNVRSAQEALALYGTQRCADGKGVTIPSQIRYVGYYERFLKGILSDGPNTRMLHRLIISGIPQMATATYPFYVVIEQDGELVFTNKDEQETTSGSDTGTPNSGADSSPDSAVTEIALELDTMVSGDVAIRLMHMEMFSSDAEVCAVCFNVEFLHGNHIAFDRSSVDWRQGVKKVVKKVDDRFSVSLVLRPPRPVSHA
eukprot:m.282580 g.282580  ORF g.282580 m.282580 type:complete len:800 (+) comp19855_c0_seq2:179-2578(+)